MEDSELQDIFDEEDDEAAAWDLVPIPRADTSSSGETRLGRRSLDAAGVLGLVLHYLNSTMSLVSLQQIFALIAATVSRYLFFGLNILLSTLQNMYAARIRWPRDDEFENFTQLITARHPLLYGTFGMIDGLNLPVQVSSDPEIENAHYNGWLHAHFKSWADVSMMQYEHHWQKIDEK
jgi:hypothetical protein